MVVGVGGGSSKFLRSDTSPQEAAALSFRALRGKRSVGDGTERVRRCVTMNEATVIRSNEMTTAATYSAGAGSRQPLAPIHSSGYVLRSVLCMAFWRPSFGTLPESFGDNETSWSSGVRKLRSFRQKLVERSL